MRGREAAFTKSRSRTLQDGEKKTRKKTGHPVEHLHRGGAMQGTLPQGRGETGRRYGILIRHEEELRPSQAPSRKAPEKSFGKEIRRDRITGYRGKVRTPLQKKKRWNLAILVHKRIQFPRERQGRASPPTMLVRKPQRWGEKRSGCGTFLCRAEGRQT